MRLLASSANFRIKNSWASQFRQRRFQFLRTLIAAIPGPVSILDVGGTADFWLNQLGGHNPSWQITLLNLYEPSHKADGFTYVQGDARDLSRFSDKSFSLVVSNSVIEHVGTIDDQKRMANEVKRVAQRYYIQTPNRYFPIEPHFLTPGFQFLPQWAKVWLVQHFRLGTYDIVKDRDHAVELVNEIRLMSGKEFRGMFSGASVIKEKFCGLTKSFTAYEGWEPSELVSNAA
jgi:ubiquinone/menaquinone biosynthesis C-methylase UbiE